MTIFTHFTFAIQIKKKEPTQRDVIQKEMLHQLNKQC